MEYVELLSKHRKFLKTLSPIDKEIFILLCQEFTRKKIHKIRQYQQKYYAKSYGKMLKNPQDFLKQFEKKVGSNIAQIYFPSISSLLQKLQPLHKMAENALKEYQACMQNWQEIEASEYLDMTLELFDEDSFDVQKALDTYKLLLDTYFCTVMFTIDSAKFFLEVKIKAKSDLLFFKARKALGIK